MNFSNLSNMLEAKQTASMNWIQSWGDCKPGTPGKELLGFIHLWFSELYAICLTSLYFMRDDEPWLLERPLLATVMYLYLSQREPEADGYVLSKGLGPSFPECFKSL